MVSSFIFCGPSFYWAYTKDKNGREVSHDYLLSKVNYELNENKLEEFYTDKPLSICITDEGIGIPEKILKYIFELSSIKKRTGLDNEISTGLGLFICKMISRKLGGNINVESREDSGSKFTLSLPLDIVVNE